jgi:aspartyl-tRNA synthetase
MAIASGFEKVFVNAPVFRAEKSLTRKHATEFTGFDLEFNNVYSRFDVMIKEEQMLTYMLKKLYPFFSKQIEEEFSQSYKEQLRNDYNLLLNKYKNKNLAQDIKFLLENASVIYKNKPKLKEIRENNKKHGYKGLFPVLTLKQVYKELEKEYGYKVDEQEKGDINAEGEKFVYLLAMKKFGSEFMFIDGYGKENRPFYHARDKNNVPDGFDLI